MAFINGFLALVSSIGAGTVTELQVPGYARQPVQFNTPKNGISVNANAYNFGRNVPVGIGRAIFDAPAGGNLLLIMPTASFPRARTLYDMGDVGTITLQLSAMASYPDGSAFYGTLPPAAVIGNCWDVFDVVNGAGIISGAGLPVGQNVGAIPQPVINTAQLSSGVQLTVERGQLLATIRRTSIA